MAYVQKVKTASGATALQIVEKRHGVRWIVAHVGSAHDDAELAVLMASARGRIHAGQQAFDLSLTADAGGSRGAVVTGSASEVLWEVLLDAYRRLRFDDVADEAFRSLALRPAGRPIFHRDRDAIEAHLTVVFAALAVSRHLQDATGVSMNKLILTLRLRTVRINVNGHPITAAPQITGDARALLDRLPAITAPGH